MIEVTLTILFIIGIFGVLRSNHEDKKRGKENSSMSKRIEKIVKDFSDEEGYEIYL